MFSFQQAHINGEFDPNFEGWRKMHSRKNVIGVGRTRHSFSKKRSTRSRASGQAIVGIGHRRNRKWTW